MAKKAAKQQKKKSQTDYGPLMKWAGAIALIAFGIILALAAFGLAGAIGATLFSFFFGIIGAAAFLVPVAVIALGLMLLEILKGEWLPLLPMDAQEHDEAVADAHE